MLNKFLFLGSVIFLLFSCSNDSEDDVVSDDMVPEETVITYEANISSLISSRCLGCHDDPTTNGAPVSFNTFDLVSDGSSNILNSMQGINGFSLMPQSGSLTTAEIELFEKWITDGLLEN